MVGYRQFHIRGGKWMKRMMGSGCLVLAAMLWGMSQVFSKYVLDEVQPFTLTFLRFILASFTLGFFVFFGSPVKFSKRDLAKLSLLGFIGYTLSIGLQLAGIKLSTAHNATVITSTPPVFMFLFSIFILREKFSWKKGVALLVSTIGVGIVIGADVSVEGSMAGNMLLIFSSVAWALYSVLIKLFSDKYPLTIVTFYALTFAGIFAFPFSLYEFKTYPLLIVNNHLVWAGVLYIGVIATAAGFWLWNKGVYLLETNTAGLFLFVQPVFGSLLAWILLGEHLTTAFFSGSLLIAAGILISQFEIHRLFRNKISFHQVMKDHK